MDGNYQKEHEKEIAVLGSLHRIFHNSSTYNDILIQKQQPKSLLMTVRQFRLQKLKEVFMQKANQCNSYAQPHQFIIKSQKQIQEQRIIKIKGIQLNQYVVSLIYILDMLFTIVNVIMATFTAFLNDFVDSGASDSVVVTIIQFVALGTVLSKMFVSSANIVIQRGITLFYITDLFMRYVQSMVIFADLGHFILIILSIITSGSRTIAVIQFMASSLKLFTMYTNLKVIQATFVDSQKKENYWNLMKVAALNLLVAHFVCSAFLAMAKLDNNTNWMISINIQDNSWIVQYLWGFYWATTTMMTVGFGDITAVTYEQATIVAFIELFSCIILAYNISEIGGIISSIRSSDSTYQRKIGIFKRMIKGNTIESELQKKIQDYIKEEKQIKEKFQFMQQSQLIKSLPDYLQTEYIISSNQNIFSDLPFFNSLQKNTLYKFAQCFSGSIYYPGEYLTKFNEFNEFILILKTGKVGMVYKKLDSYLNGSVVQEINIKEKSVITEESFQQKKQCNPILLNTTFLSRMKNVNYDMRSLTYAFAYQLKVEDFFQHLKDSSIDLQFYFNVIDRHPIVLNEWQRIICEYCKNKFHNKFDCPKLHYIPLRQVIILKSFNSSGSQEGYRNSIRYRPRSQSCLSLVKKYFNPYSLERNIRGTSRIYNMSYSAPQILMNLFKLDPLNGNINKENDLTKSNSQNKQMYLTLQKIVREAIEQKMTGYKSIFWDLQMDKMHNYSAYFPSHNPKTLDLVKLNKKSEEKKYNKFEKIFKF